MEEHTFGTFSTDALKLVHERALALGLQHRVQTVPPDPLPDEPFTLVVTSGADFAAQDVVVFYTTDGTPPTLQSTAVPCEKGQRQWNTVSWSYVTTWHATLPAMPEGTLLRYRIAGREVNGAWQWADWPDPQRLVEQALVDSFREGAAATYAQTQGEQEFVRLVDHFAPPQWAREALIYHVFLDRFARDDDAPWPDVPLVDFHGGTLRGVIQHLDHIRDLGMTCIWLSPLFPTPSHHGYDASDYYTVEPRFGSKADLQALVDEAHQRGLRVILDFTCNHVSNEHPAFQRALADPDSPERGWFWFDTEGSHGYRAFFDVASMPELNTDHPGARDYLINAAAMWLRDVNVDGFRLDYAHGPSHAFWAYFWKAMKAIKPDVWCVGEVVDTPHSQLSYAGYLDGVLDFHVGDALRRVFAYGNRDVAWLDHLLHDQDAFFPPHDRFSRPTFLDNHDMDRFIYRTAGKSEAALRLAALFLYSLPAPPIVYYGTEIGLAQRYGKLEGYGQEVSREPMPWTFSAAEQGLVAFFQRLAQVRRSESAMRPTRRETLIVTADSYIGRHWHGAEPLLLLLNRAEAPTTLHHEALRGTFRDLLADKTVEWEGAVEVEGVTGILLKPI